MSLSFRFILELIHPFAGRQSRICKTVMAEPRHCKNAIEDQRVEKDGECFQVIDMNLAMDFPLNAIALYDII